MGFDSLIKKYFVAVVLGLIAVAAYFQAAGATQLLGASLIPDENTLAVVPKLVAPPAPKAPERKTAKPILDRNPFDSATGPLTAEPTTVDLPEAEADLSDPLKAPACGEIKVAIVTESTDPLWSSAALQGTGETKPIVRRVGDKVGDAEVAYIGFNRFEGSPSVWLTQGSTLCQAMLFAAQPQPGEGAQKPAAPGEAESESEATPGRRGAPPIPADMKAHIQKVSETEFNVDRSVVDKILENQSQLMRSARIVPEQKDGKVVGVRLFGIRPDTLLGTLGLQNGDRLETINGFNMSSPEKALEAYARLRTSEKLQVQVTRRGKPMSIDFNIK